MRGGGACQILFVSWTDIFPVMDVDMVGTYQSEASSREKEALAQLFEVEAVHNVRKTGHVVATGLFWKPASPGEAEYPQPTEEIMRNPAEHGLPSRFKNPWEHYVEPVFKAPRHLGEIRPDLVYRVYLANDLLARVSAGNNRKRCRGDDDNDSYWPLTSRHRRGFCRFRSGRAVPRGRSHTKKIPVAQRWSSRQLDRSACFVELTKSACQFGFL
jgi:hypothetical protein